MVIVHVETLSVMRMTEFKMALVVIDALVTILKYVEENGKIVSTGLVCITFMKYY